MGQTNIGSSVDAPPMSKSLVIEIDTTSKPPIVGYALPEQHTSWSTHVVVDVEHDTIAQCEMIFLGSS